MYFILRAWGLLPDSCLISLQRLEHFSYKGRLRVLGSLSLENRRFGMRVLSMYFKTWRCKEDRPRLFSVAWCQDKRSVHKLNHRRIHLTMRQHFGAVLVMKYWHRLPETLWNLLEIFRSSLDVSCTHCSGCPCLSRGWSRWTPGALLTLAVLWHKGRRDARTTHLELLLLARNFFLSWIHVKPIHGNWGA